MDAWSNGISLRGVDIDCVPGVNATRENRISLGISIEISGVNATREDRISLGISIEVSGMDAAREDRVPLLGINLN